jgi:hypothetical protein
MQQVEWLPQFRVHSIFGYALGKPLTVLALADLLVRAAVDEWNLFSLYIVLVIYCIVLVLKNKNKAKGTDLGLGIGRYDSHISSPGVCQAFGSFESGKIKAFEAPS